MKLLSPALYIIAFAPSHPAFAKEGLEDSVFHQTGRSSSSIGKMRILRKREVKAAVNPPAVPKVATRVSNVFGNVVNEEQAEEIRWSRLIAETSYPIEPRCKFDLELDCFLSTDNSVSCKDYMNFLAVDPSMSCKIGIVNEFSIKNIGNMPEEIIEIKTAVNGERPYVTSIEEVPQNDRHIEPGQILTANVTKSLDFCSNSTQDTGMTFEIVTNCINGDFYTEASKYDFDPIPVPSCGAQIDLSCGTLDGSPCCPRSQSRACTFRPYYFDFFLSGGLCAASDNSQGSDKFSCIDNGDITEYSDFFVVVEGSKSRDAYFTGFVSKNEVISVGHGYKVDADMKVSVFSAGGHPLQRFSFHSSCSKNLDLGDVFGAITIDGFRDDHRNVTRSSTAQEDEFKITYEVRNEGQNSISLADLVFSFADQETVTVPVGGNTILPNSFQSGSTGGFNVTTDAFEALATLRYETLPSFNAQNCLETVRYKRPKCNIRYSKSKKSKKAYGKGGKGKSPKSYKSVGSKGKGKSPKSYKSSGSKGKGKSPKGYKSTGTKGKGKSYKSYGGGKGFETKGSTGSKGGGKGKGTGKSKGQSKGKGSIKSKGFLKGQTKAVGTKGKSSKNSKDGKGGKGKTTKNSKHGKK